LIQKGRLRSISAIVNEDHSLEAANILL
jgi:predicted glycoside hydrolase/deacetylase ChbG (UPF0249 family)